MAIERIRRIGLACVISTSALSGAAMAQTAPPQPTPGGLRGAEPVDAFTPGLGIRAARDMTPGPRTTPVLTFGLRSQLLLSDNIGLAPPGEERDGLILEISPTLRAEINRPRLQAQLDYVLRNFYIEPDVGYEGPQHEVRGLGNMALKDDWLWLAGQALVHEVNTSPFEASSADPGSRVGNRTGYRRFDVSPYVRGQLGAQTRYEAGYAFNAVQYSGDQLDSTAHRLHAQIARDPSLHRFGYQVSADGSQREFDGGADYETTNARLLGLYRPGHTLTIGAGADYTRINVVTSDSGETGGWGPVVFMGWRPTPRTEFTVLAADAYYGKYGTATLSHRAGNWSLSVQYDQGIIDGSEAGLVYAGRTMFTPGQQGDAANPVMEGLGELGTIPGFGTPLATGLLGAALVDQRRLTASLGWLRRRNAIALTVFTSRDKAVQTNIPLPGSIAGLDDLEQHGAVLRYDRQLSPQTRGTLQGAVTHSEARSGTLESDLVVFDAILSRDFSRNTTMSIGYRWTEQSGTTEYRENAVIATLDYRF